MSGPILPFLIKEKLADIMFQEASVRSQPATFERANHMLVYRSYLSRIATLQVYGNGNPRSANIKKEYLRP